MRALGFTALILAIAGLAYVGSRSVQEVPASPATRAAAPVPLKEAKLNIEHNATDRDTGFQGFVDSEGWRTLEARGPKGKILQLAGRGKLAKLGLTELFFETVEPENADTPIRTMLAKLPAGRYRFTGAAQEDGERKGRTRGTAVLTHDIPKGPRLVSPARGATVATRGVVADWDPVENTITGEPVRIVAYQLIIEKDANPPRNMIGKFGLSMYVRPSVTTIDVPDGFLEPKTAYSWEVLAIERSGNQTISSSGFRTR